MQLTRKIEISALNIAMHAPHSAQKYIQLFLSARRKNILIQLGTVHGAILGSAASENKDDPKKFIVGEIYRFIRIDPKEPWFNIKTSEPATEQEMGKVKIPDNLLPNLRRIEYVFDPQKHRLWFVSSDRKDQMGPSMAAEFFQTLFDRVCVEDGFPKVEVTPFPDQEALDTMLSLPQLDFIRISLTRPNPDDAEELDARFLKRLEDQGIERWNQELRATAGQTIRPDAETSGVISVASRNGFVEVEGRDGEGNRYSESTVAKPLRMLKKVNSEIEVSQDVLLRAAHGLTS